MTTLAVLNLFLINAFIIAPLMTNRFFLEDSVLYSWTHKFALLIVLLGLATGIGPLAFAWLLFCFFGFGLYVNRQRKLLLSAGGAARCVPFVFSLISATWYVAGSNDLHLLGYDSTWSFYAALHGSFIGWIFIGCLAFLSRHRRESQLYVASIFLSLLFFLLIAFGIDGVPYIKRMGLVGFTLLIPGMIGIYHFQRPRNQKASRLLTAASLTAILLSMIIAVLHEFWQGFPRVMFGMPTMIVTHGLLNAAIAMPCFCGAVAMSEAGGIFRRTTFGFAGKGRS